MDDQVLRQLRQAYAKLATGDDEGFAEVLDDEVHWRGAPRGFLRKRHLYWHGVEGTRAVLRGQRDKLRATASSATATVEIEPGDSEQAVVMSTIVPGKRQVFQVINVRHGRIVHIRDVRSRRQARQLAGIHRRWARLLGGDVNSGESRAGSAIGRVNAKASALCPAWRRAHGSRALLQGADPASGDRRSAQRTATSLGRGAISNSLEPALTHAAGLKPPERRAAN